MTYQPLDPVAFAIAFLSAPIVFTVMYFWVLFIPLIAFIGGFVPYLVLGLPLLLWHLLRHGADEDKLHGFTLKSIVAIGIFAMIIGLATDKPYLFGFALYGTIFGVMIGPLWAIQFCRIYLKFERRFGEHKT